MKEQHHTLAEGFPRLAANLEALLKSRNLSTSKMAQILGIPMMTIRRLLSGETTDPRISTLKLIADYFGVSVNSLVEDLHLMTESSGQSKPFLVPVLDWQTAENCSASRNLNNWAEWQPVALHEKNLINQNTFALKSRPSMYPRFPQGTVFIISPDVLPTDGDIVLVKMIKNNELTLRELTIDPPEWKLHPIVPGSVVLEYSQQEHKIVGVNILTMLYNRSNV